MEAQRITNILNVYAELKAKDEQFKDVEPCFIEGNERLVKLWTTAQQEGGSGDENPFEFEMESGDGEEGGEKEKGEKEKGEGKGKSTGGKKSGENESEGEGEGEGNGAGKGEGEKEGEGKSDGEEKDGQGEKKSDSDGEGKEKEDGEGKDGEEKDGQGQHGKQKEGEGEQGEPQTDEGGMQPQPSPSTEEPEVEQQEQENPLEYKMRFPSITEMIYGIKICNETSEEDEKRIFEKLFVGIGIVVCRNLMSEAGTLGESVLGAKKKSYIGVFEMLMLLFARKERYDSQGNILGKDDDDKELESLILCDKFMYKMLPVFAVFNRDTFNQNQLTNAIEFCMASFSERSTVLVSEKYTNDNTENNWGLLVWSGSDYRNYETSYYRHTASYDKEKKNNRYEVHRLKTTVVTKGNLDFSLDLSDLGEEFFGFMYSLILNYLNCSTQEIDQQAFMYKNKKKNIMDAQANLLKIGITKLEKQF